MPVQAGITVPGIYRKGKPQLNSGMDIYDIRRENLKALVENAGGPTRFADKTGRSQSQISQLLTGKNIGAKLARAIEREIGLPVSWMDHPQGVQEPSAPYTADHLQLNRKQREILDLLESLSPEDRAHWRAVGRAFVKPKGRNKRNNGTK